MVTIKNAAGVTLSANATLNGFPRVVVPFKVPGMGDYAKRDEGRARRRQRLERIALKRAELN